MVESLTSAHDLPAWRERILRALLVSTCWFAALAYIPGVWLAIKYRLWSIAVADTVAYGAVLLLAFLPGVPYGIRAWVMTALAYLLGVVLLAVTGMSGGGMIWIASAPVFAAIVLGLRAAIAVLVVNGLTLLAYGGAIAWGVLAYGPQPPFTDGGLAAFVVAATNAFLLSTAIAWATAALLRGLEENRARLVQEIDDRVKAMAERERLEQQLREAHKLEAVGRLASGVAHDFNNLLVPILGNADELRRRVATGSAEAAALGDIITSAERGRSLVDRVLTFSRRATAPRRAVRLADVVRDAAQLLRAGLPASVQLVQQLDAPDAVVMADPTELHQVVMNLGTNAAHAMREQGGVLTFALAADGQRATLQVRDTGTGMTPEVRDRACEPFFTTKPAGEGSGLGLATVHAIVASLEGRLTIDTAPGRGTVVGISLPLAVDQDAVDRPPPDAVADEAAAIAPASRGRILIVDDEPLVLRLCTTVLTREGYEVTAVADPREAAVLVERSASSFDLLLTDKAMPGFSGIELASIARTANPDLPVVLATGYLDDAARLEAESSGITKVIAKPYRTAELTRVIREALAPRSTAP